MSKATIIRARVLAFYLPQFHPTPENDQWWGPGFTEWTNVARARPLFRGHKQPVIPGELGFYDLRLPETRQAQATLARDCGIEGFCYWHYWFAGKRLLERPFDEVLASGKPDFPFCLGWANHSWTGVWVGAENRTLVEQTYPGPEDNRRHSAELLPAFQDPRYIRVDGKPLLLVFEPNQIPEPGMFWQQWQRMALAAGLKGLHVVAHFHGEPSGGESQLEGYNAATIANLKSLFGSRKVPIVNMLRRHLTKYRLTKRLAESVSKKPIHVVPYDAIAGRLVIERSLPFEYYPCVMPNWDNTPRSGSRGIVLTETSPKAFETQLTRAVARVEHLPSEHRIIFVKSWNEWAEGNYLEPDSVNGRAYLDAVRNVLRAGGPF